MNATKLYYYRAVVCYVYDGDTVRADIDLGFEFWARRKSLRLRGIDSPELRGETRVAGLVARDYLRGLVHGKSVMIRSYKAGKYGRWIADIYLDGEEDSVNEMMIHAGHAVPYGS